MRHWVTYPMVTHPFDPAFATKDAVVRFAQEAERAGFDGMGFTDHPAPSDRWLRNGGHDALDPFAALAFVAAVTDRLLLIPNIVVLPYRNPFLVAKAVATIDALSGGRFVLSTAVGYQRAEYRALGVDYDERNDLFDEAIEVIKGIWSTDDFAYDGHHFFAKGQTANPKPSHAPIWIGGNSQLSRRRAATVADGWNPFPAPRSIASTTKTVALETLDDLAPLIGDLWQRVDAAGRDRSEVDVSFSNLAGGTPGCSDFDAGAAAQGEADLADLGVTWTAVSVPGGSVEHAIEALQAYGEQVIQTGASA
jgi:probable F420-dependent oxidoreductase